MSCRSRQDLVKPKVSLRLVLFVLLLTSCASIPSVSPVHQLPTSQPTTDTQFVRVIAHPPKKDAKPQSIIQGFLDACADSSDDYAIARDYLLPATSIKWRPDAEVTAYDATTRQIVRSGTEYRVSGTMTGYIDIFRHFTPAVSPKPLIYRLTVTRDSNNQWRIASVPDGVIAPSADVQRRWRGHAVYFWDSSHSHLVPDSVVLPRGSSGTATSLMQALLAGPRASLVSILNSDVPVGARLSYGSIPISSATATVDLTVPHMLTGKTYERLAAQIMWTLTQIDSIRKVKILFAGRPFSGSSLPATLSVEDFSVLSPEFPQSASRLYAVQARVVQRLSAETGQGMRFDMPANATSQAASLAANPFAQEWAAVGAMGKNLYVRTRADSEFRQVFAGESLSKPSWSRFGTVYAADYGHWIASVNRNGKISFLRVSPSQLGGATDVSRIAVAPDGIRVALVFGTVDASSIATGIMVQDGSHMRVEGVAPVAAGYRAIRDMVWVDGLHIAVLLATEATTSTVQIISLTDGSYERISIPFEARSFAFGPRGNLVIGAIRQGQHQILERKQGTWVLRGLGDSPTFAQ